MNTVFAKAFLAFLGFTIVMIMMTACLAFAETVSVRDLMCNQPATIEACNQNDTARNCDEKRKRNIEKLMKLSEKCDDIIIGFNLEQDN